MSLSDKPTIASNLDKNWLKVVDSAGNETEGSRFVGIFRELFTVLNNFIVAEDINNQFEEAGFGERASVKYDSKTNIFVLTYQPIEGEAFTKILKKSVELLDYSSDIIGLEYAESENARLAKAGLGLILKVEYSFDSNFYSVGVPAEGSGVHGFFTGEEVKKYIDQAIAWAKENPVQI